MSLIAPNRNNAMTGEGGRPTSRTAEFLERVAKVNNDIDTAMKSYTVTNPVERRSFDTTTVTVSQLAEVLSTVIADLQQ